MPSTSRTSLRTGRRRGLRTRWRLLKAQLSVPTLLSRLDERKVVSIVAALDGAAALLVISLAAWWSGLPLLFPSLAPSAFIMFTRPFSEAASPRSMILGHSMAIGCGWLSWTTMSFVFGHPVSLAHLDLALCLSADLAFALTCILLVRLSCHHAPACATALIVASGGITAGTDMLIMVVAVVLLTYQGVLIHRLLGVHAPLWKIDAPHAAGGDLSRHAA